MTVEEETKAGMGMTSTGGTGTVIEGRIRVEVASGGGIGMMTGINRGNGVKTSDGTETGMFMAAIAIQTNGTAQGNDGKGVATREIEHRAKVTTPPLLYRMYLCTFIMQRVSDRRRWLRMRMLVSRASSYHLTASPFGHGREDTT